MKRLRRQGQSSWLEGGGTEGGDVLGRANTTEALQRPKTSELMARSIPWGRSRSVGKAASSEASSSRGAPKASGARGNNSTWRLHGGQATEAGRQQQGYAQKFLTKISSSSHQTAPATKASSRPALKCASQVLNRSTSASPSSSPCNILSPPSDQQHDSASANIKHPEEHDSPATSAVLELVSFTGIGCCQALGNSPGAWITDGKLPRTESSCIVKIRTCNLLELEILVTPVDAASTPAELHLSHAPDQNGPFEALCKPKGFADTSIPGQSSPHQTRFRFSVAEALMPYLKLTFSGKAAREAHPGSAQPHKIQRLRLFRDQRRIMMPLDFAEGVPNHIEPSLLLRPKEQVLHAPGEPQAPLAPSGRSIDAGKPCAPPFLAMQATLPARRAHACSVAQASRPREAKQLPELSGSPLNVSLLLSLAAQGMKGSIDSIAFPPFTGISSSGRAPLHPPSLPALTLPYATNQRGNEEPKEDGALEPKGEAAAQGYTEDVGGQSCCVEGAAGATEKAKAVPARPPPLKLDLATRQKTAAPPPPPPPTHLPCRARRSCAPQLTSELLANDAPARPPALPGKKMSAAPPAPPPPPPFSGKKRLASPPPPPPLPRHVGGALHPPPPDLGNTPGAPKTPPAPPLPGKKMSAAPPPPPLPEKKSGVCPPPPPPLPGTDRGAPPSRPPPLMPGKTASMPPPPPPPVPGKTRPTAPPPSRAKPTAHAAAQQGSIAVTGPIPRIPVKKLHWNKLPNHMAEATVWQELAANLQQLRLDFAGLEADFAAKAIHHGKHPKAEAGGRGQSKIMLLPMKRSQNIGVFISRLKLTPAKVLPTIMALCNNISVVPDAIALSHEDVEGLRGCMPTPDEQKILKGYDGKISDLATVEQVMLAFLEIPCLSQRLEAALFQQSYKGRLQDIALKIRNLQTANDEVKSSEQLRNVLRIVLAVGNFLNAGSFNGAAQGFQLEVLLKLKEVKSTKSRSKNLLHFVHSELIRLDPEAATLRQELEHTELAGRLDVKGLQSEIQELERQAQSLERTLQLVKPLGEHDTFQGHMSHVHKEASSGIASATIQLEEAIKSFGQLCTYLMGKGADQSKLEPQSFYQLLSTFSSDLDAVRREEIAEKLKAETKAHKEANKEAKKEAMKTARKSAFRVRSPGSKPMPAFRRRDKLLSHVRAYSKLSPGERRTLLTHKGARERLATIGLTRCQSCPDLRRRSDQSTNQLPQKGFGAARATPKPEDKATNRNASLYASLTSMKFRQPARSSGVLLHGAWSAPRRPRPSYAKATSAGWQHVEPVAARPATQDMKNPDVEDLTATSETPGPRRRIPLGGFVATPAVPRIGAPARQSRDSSPLVPRLDLVAAAAASQGQQGLQVSSATRRRRLWHAVHLASPHSVSWADDSATPAVKYGYPPGLPRAERSVSPEVTPTKSGVFRLQQASVAARLRQPAHASLLREEQEPPRSRGARLSCYPQSSELRTPTSTMESLRDSVRDSVDQFNLLTARGPLSASAMGLPPVREGTPDSLAWEADQATGHDLSDDESLSDFCDSDEDSIPDESLCDTPLFDTPECYSETSTPEDTPAAESGTSPALARTHMMPKLKLEETRRSLMTELTEVLNTRRSMAQDQGLLHHQAFDSVDLISSVTLQAGLSTEKPPTGKRGGFRAAGKFFRKAAGKLLK